jgi:hypothetical protein
MKRFALVVTAFLAAASIAQVLTASAAPNPPALGGTGTSQLPQPVKRSSATEPEPTLPQSSRLGQTLSSQTLRVA